MLSHYNFDYRTTQKIIKKTAAKINLSKMKILNFA